MQNPGSHTITYGELKSQMGLTAMAMSPTSYIAACLAARSVVIVRTAL